MKAKSLLIVAMVLVMAGAVLAAPAAAKNAVVPFQGTYTTHPAQVGFNNGVITLQIPGEGQATHLGNSTWYADSWVDTNYYPFVQTGVMTFTAANGDQLSGTFAGHAAPSGAAIEFWGGFTVTGGTGRFAGATGTGAYWGSAEGSDGTLTFDGTLSK